MFQGMEKNLRDRVMDQSAKDKKEIDDWLAGSGSKVFGLLLVALCVWGVVRLFWS